MQQIYFKNAPHTCAWVDDDDYEYLSGFDWLLIEGRSEFGYAGRCADSRTYLMHREVLDAPKELVVDHRNGDTLDNRKQNLRLCTTAENLCNRKRPKHNKSGFKGVYFHKHNKKWKAQIKYQGKKYEADYDTPEAAARAYDTKARELHGEFARTNFPLESSESVN